jgi:hypothetical protein
MRMAVIRLLLVFLCTAGCAGYWAHLWLSGYPLTELQNILFGSAVATGEVLTMLAACPVFDRPRKPKKS